MGCLLPKVDTKLACINWYPFFLILKVGNYNYAEEGMGGAGRESMREGCNQGGVGEGQGKKGRERGRSAAACS
jgi:hypothetical protein